MKDAYKMYARKPEEKDHMGDLGTEGRIVIEMNSKERRCRGVGWVQLAQVTIWWHAVTN